MKTLKQKLKAGDAVFATTVANVAWSGLIEIYKHERLDFLMFDTEHGRFSVESIENLLRTSRLLGIETVVRVPDTNYIPISRSYDMGASGVLIPRVESVEQAKEAMSCAKFPPIGRKGCGGFSLLKGVDGLERFNDQKTLLFQIESPEGIDRLDAILQATDVDGIIVGPTDLSITAGHPLKFDHPKVRDAILQVFSICKSRGVSCGLYTDDFEDMRFYRQNGANILWSGAEAGFIKAGYQKLMDHITRLEET